MGDSDRIHVGPSFTRGAKENGWDEATSQDFKVRGAAYLKDKIKISSGSPAFHLAGVWPWPYAAQSPKSHACARVPSGTRFRRVRCARVS